MSKKKSAIRKQNKKMVKVVVIVAAAAMLFSAAFAAFGSFAPSVAGGSNASTIAELELRISQYEANLESSPDNVTLLTQLGNTYYQLGTVYNDMEEWEKSEENFAKAVEPYGKALEIEPDDVNVRVDRAVSAYYSGSMDLAKEQFEIAIETDPTHLNARYNYGIYNYFGLGDAVAAIEQWNKVIELNPNVPGMVDNARNLIAQAEMSLNQLIGDPSQFDGDGEAEDVAEQDDESADTDEETEDN